MKFVSYAQNFEDVLLWRALHHIEKGFYVDIGAQDPVIDSVSLAFYERGWRGVHVEPSPQYAARLREVRSDEAVIEAALGAESGYCSFFEIPDTGLGTADREIATQHRAAGFEVRETAVEFLTLTQLLRPYANQDIHWMKIDVEGYERQVIEGWDGERVRPWIVLVESTRPNSEVQAHNEWEPLLLKRGYGFAFFDGLNRYYISEAHPELRASLNRPANVFDNFERIELVQLRNALQLERERVHEIQAELQRLQALVESREADIGRLQVEVSRLSQELSQVRSRYERLLSREIALTNELISNNHLLSQSAKQVARLRLEYEAVVSSRSWRVTRPLREVAARFRRILRGRREREPGLGR